jgi:hypothetical protein
VPTSAHNIASLVRSPSCADVSVCRAPLPATTSHPSWGPRHVWTCWCAVPPSHPPSLICTCRAWVRSSALLGWSQYWGSVGDWVSGASHVSALIGVFPYISWAVGPCRRAYKKHVNWGSPSWTLRDSHVWFPEAHNGGKPTPFTPSPLPWPSRRRLYSSPISSTSGHGVLLIVVQDRRYELRFKF